MAVTGSLLEDEAKKIRSMSYGASCSLRWEKINKYFLENRVIWEKVTWGLIYGTVNETFWGVKKLM